MLLMKKLTASFWVVLLLCCSGNALAVSGEQGWTESDEFVINPGLNDAWGDPLTNGQGFSITVFEEKGTVSLTWFTYDTELPDSGVTANLGDPGQRWLVAVGAYEGARAELEVYSASGGLFDAGFPAPEVNPVGSILLQFDDCHNGVISYELPDINRSGSIPIERVASDNIALCKALSTPVLPAAACYISKGDAPTVVNRLFAVWGNNSNDVFVVGGDGTILHYDGLKWTPMAWGGGFALEGVWGSSSTDVYAVGGADGFGLAVGIILHYDGHCWHEVFSTTDYQFTDVWGSSNRDIFATTSRGGILHYDGTGWTPMKLNTGAWDSLGGVWGTGPDDVYAVGGSDIWHYDGSDWQLMTTVGSNSLRRVWGSSATDIFAVGANYTPTQTEAAIWHYDGDHWTFMPSDTEGMRWSVWGSDPHNVFAVGDVAGRGLVSNYNGTAWNTESASMTPTLQGVWGSGPNDIFTVGGGARNGWCCTGEGTILHFDGNTWQTLMAYGQFK